ncbi:MAG: 30S ribosomal protein S9 [Candidatus Moranbacteria bacterium]|nr:30S ribosomal protein S9 [Candidatus Moranbacteria bacterium]
MAEKKESNKYFKGIGRRKSSVAQVRLFVSPGKKSSPGDISINGRAVNDFFGLSELRSIASIALESVGTTSAFKVTVNVKGGGIRGQAEAIRLGIARALVVFDESFKKPLRDLGYLTRDARIVERKKPGLKKARRAPQWAKR